MKTILRVACVLVIPLVALGLASTRKSKFVGRIVAYRPADRISQVASFSPNEEVFLFEIEDGKTRKRPQIVKIEYRHFGITNISQETLEATSLMILKAKRNASCDQTYDQFVSTAPTLREQGSENGFISGVSFIEKFKDLRIASEEILRCYVIEKGDLQILGNDGRQRSR
jgi:hypothetical protein